MANADDPTLIRIEDLTDTYDPYLVEESRDRARQHLDTLIPARFRHAAPTHDTVAAWVRAVVTAAVHGARRSPCIVLGEGPSLTLLGPTGTGKTHQAYAALRALAASGVRMQFQMATAAEIYARLRPRHRIDSESEFQLFAHAQLLVMDDLGAAKNSEWVEEVNYRLINHRYEHALPTLFTSNVPVAQLKERLGERVASRLREMSTRAVLDGPDRREPAA